ncbi:hypothetical protein ScPMuIL_005112 [Solemya velum]
MAMNGVHSFQTGQRNSFHNVDYILFAFVLAFSAGIGIFYAIKDRKKTNTKEFLLAGGNMSPIPVSLSLLASFMSAITLLGTPAEIYSFSTIYLWIGLAYLFVVAGAAHIFVPVFYRLRVTSVYEYLEYRFSRGVRIAGSLTFCTQMLLYMAIVLYAPSLALNAVTGFNLWGAVVSVGTVCTLYTMLGGMKAVLWTDTFQIGMMFAGLFAVLIRGSMAVGGITSAWEIAVNNSRVEFVDFNPDPGQRHSFWSLVVGGTFTWIAIYGTNQAQVQRACTCPSLKAAQIAMWLNFPGLCLLLITSCLIGIIMYAFYSSCDPISYNLVAAKDQVKKKYVHLVLIQQPRIPSLRIHTSYFIKLFECAHGIEYLILCGLNCFFCFISVLLFGSICLALSYVASQLGDVLEASLSLFGMIGGPLLGLFCLGMFFPWANSYGAYCGLFSSIALLLWIGVGTKVVKPFIQKSPLSIVGCNWNITSTAAMTIANATSSTNTTLTSALSITSAVTTTVEDATRAGVDREPFLVLVLQQYNVGNNTDFSSTHWVPPRTTCQSICTRLFQGPTVPALHAILFVVQRHGRSHDSCDRTSSQFSHR